MLNKVNKVFFSLYFIALFDIIGVVPTFLPDPTSPRKGNWWGPDRKSSWLKSSEVTVVTMLEENESTEGCHGKQLSSEKKFTDDGDLETHRLFNPERLNKVNTSEVKIVPEKLQKSDTKNSCKNWLENTSIFKLDSMSQNTITSQNSIDIQSSDSTNSSNSSGSSFQYSLPRTTSIEPVNEVAETKINSESVIVPKPKSYEVTIDSSGKIHMARPNLNDNPNNRVLNVTSKSYKDKTGSSNNTVKEVQPIAGENPAPYTVVINHNGMLDTIQTSPNMKIPVITKCQ